MWGRISYGIYLIWISCVLSIHLDINMNPGDEIIETVLKLHSSVATAEDIMGSYVCILIEGDPCQCHESYDIGRFNWSDACKKKAEFVLQYKSAYSLALTLKPTTIHNIPYIDKQPQRIIATTPVYLDSLGAVKQSEPSLTLVLPLTIDDLSRASVLLYSLQKMKADIVYEMLIFTPSQHQSIIEGALLGIASKLHLPFQIKVLNENILFTRSSSEQLQPPYPYAIQMTIKLLAAKFIQTSYYLTLDADIIQLHELELSNLILPMESSSRGSTEYKALYHWEKRSIHENWWLGSERIANINYNTSYVYNNWGKQDKNYCINTTDEACLIDTIQYNNVYISETQRYLQGFGVTPAILSTYGSILTVSHICRSLTINHDETMPIDWKQCEEYWLDNFGRILNVESNEVVLWSEYTLYRIVLDYYEVTFISNIGTF